MFEDKIIIGGEITTQGDFVSPNRVFYIMPVAKSEDSEMVSILNVKLSQNEKSVDFPFVSGTWNPVVVNKISVKSDDLTKYRIFWGETK